MKGGYKYSRFSRKKKAKGKRKKTRRIKKSK